MPEHRFPPLAAALLIAALLLPGAAAANPSWAGGRAIPLAGFPLGDMGHEAAVAQLRASSGREVCFHTGVALVCARRQLDWFHVEPFSAHFRSLTDPTIEDYLRREQPYDCAGSFKCEGLGIALFERLQGNDPTSLEGLPLIALTGLLTRAGIPVLQS